MRYLQGWLSLNSKDHYLERNDVWILLSFFFNSYIRVAEELNKLPDIMVTGSQPSNLYSQEEKGKILSIYEKRKKIRKEIKIKRLSALKQTIEQKIQKVKQVF